MRGREKSVVTPLDLSKIYAQSETINMFDHPTVVMTKPRKVIVDALIDIGTEESEKQLLVREGDDVTKVA